MMDEKMMVLTVLVFLVLLANPAMSSDTVDLMAKQPRLGASLNIFHDKGGYL